ncbi:MAG: TetR/AcrR family transcriptional regulator [Gammaproteobacteria bacterium]|nr:TetR/AcrR family transcriptional regulator [Gammaproteobacteria bacterium]
MNNVNQEAGARKRGRVELKRMETRSRIIAATERLLSARPIDDVTLQDITQAAAIGHGSFYLHFKSKYEVLIPIVQARAAQVDGQLRTALAGNDDPAQIMAFSTRVMARMIVSDPLWRWFLSHSGVPVEEMRRAFGRFSNRDFQAGAGQWEVPGARY